jgi:hypothetical protein
MTIVTYGDIGELFSTRNKMQSVQNGPKTATTKICTGLCCEWARLKFPDNCSKDKKRQKRNQKRKQERNKERTISRSAKRKARGMVSSGR